MRISRAIVSQGALTRIHIVPAPRRGGLDRLAEERVQELDVSLGREVHLGQCQTARDQSAAVQERQEEQQLRGEEA